MRDWNIGVGSVDDQNRWFLWCERGPWWAFALKNIVLLCDFIPQIPLPAIPLRVSTTTTYGDVRKDLSSDESPAVKGYFNTTLKDWYGDLHSVFHIFICNRIYGIGDEQIVEEFRTDISEETAKQLNPKFVQNHLELTIDE